MSKINKILVILLFSSNAMSQPMQTRNGATYSNPVIHSDYSDPDVIRVGNDFYMVVSSFNAVPGIPILHSTDLVNWQIVNYALPELTPEKHFDTVRHGAGVWAPSIRYHNKEFYIFYPDPDFGIYVIKAKKVTDVWSEPVLVEGGKGLIDPCPFWDDDGKVYLINAFAGSRAGIKSILTIKELNPAAIKVIANAVLVYDGHQNDPTIEGPKLYKRHNYYYIFAPAGGVSTGWQTVLRSKNIFGPYERKVVLEKGTTNVNGPHQGAWVVTQNNKDWFIHFQDKEAYGRVVHLQPMQWENDWPIIGTDINGNKIGEPVNSFKTPFSKNDINNLLQTSDEFNTPQLGLQWQWQANPKNNWAFATSNGTLRLFSVYKKDSLTNLWNTPNLLLQKLPAEKFTATLKFTSTLLHDKEKFGLIIFGTNYAYLAIQKTKEGNYLVYNECSNADKGAAEVQNGLTKINSNTLYLKVNVSAGAICQFWYSQDGSTFNAFDKTFIAKPGKWVGAKIGIFGDRINVTNDSGFIDVDYFKIKKTQ